MVAENDDRLIKTSSGVTVRELKPLGELLLCNTVRYADA